MHVAVDLHVHERSASGDSRTAAETMGRVARSRLGDWVMLGLVGHDAEPTEEAEAVLSITGVENEIRTTPRRLHVIRFTDPEFSILAHPALTWPTDTRRQAAAFIDSHDIDAVEKFNGGRQQYSGHIPGVREVAGSDAHSPLVLGSSHLVVQTDTVSADAVIDAIRQGDYTIVADRPPWHRRLFERIEKSLTMVRNEPGSAFRTATERVGVEP